MSGTVKIRRALISVSDKAGLEALAAALKTHGVELISTGGTAAALRALGHAVRDVADLTGFPEMMDGRVKTLHPAVHGGLLALRGNAGHEAAMAKHGIGPIDLLVVNLYPFEQALSSEKPYAEMIETIDVGGPAMIRGAAKNHEGVAVVVDPSDYPAVIEDLAGHGGATTPELRRRLAAKAFARTAAYDSAIAGWLGAEAGVVTPAYRSFSGKLVQELRYGENPHQAAALYASVPPQPGVVTARQVQGKELSFNNIADADAALDLAAELGTDGPAVVIVKHANPCGAASGPALLEAYRKALACDPVSAFGGIVAVSRKLDEATAKEIAKLFTEVVIAPEADDAALAVFAAKPNLRVLLTGGLPDPHQRRDTVRSISGGLLVQTRDWRGIGDARFEVVTKRQPTLDEVRDLRFAFTVAKHVKSNAIVYAKDGATVGIGAGQMSRIDSARIAAWKVNGDSLLISPTTAADHKQTGGEISKLSPFTPPRFVAASEAFFPFADGLEAIAAAGATAVIQPGGSVKDAEVIAAADRPGSGHGVHGPAPFPALRGPSK